jgi:mannose-6-phosphate isomerase-like protein (cupin superfamily)
MRQTKVTSAFGCQDFLDLGLSAPLRVPLDEISPGIPPDTGNKGTKLGYGRETQPKIGCVEIRPKEEIGEEIHKLDQFFRVEEGTGEAVLEGVRTAIRAGFAVVVPAGTNHNIINTGDVPLKLYTLYAPPNHRDGVVHHTRADAEADKEHFDGKTPLVRRGPVSSELQFVQPVASRKVLDPKRVHWFKETKVACCALVSFTGSPSESSRNF